MSIIKIFLFIFPFIIAGAFQIIWLKFGLFKSLSYPVDFHKTFRGKRLFGNHKTFRGFILFSPVPGLVFYLLHQFDWYLPFEFEVFKNYSPFLVGLYLGFAYMLGELPNSFLKRQLGVSEGTTASRGLTKYIGIINDQYDSVIMTSIALYAIQDMSLKYLFCLALVSGFIHYLFNVILFLVRIKKHPY